jgi:arabinose-5-phosphate isomerase
MEIKEIIKKEMEAISRIPLDKDNIQEILNNIYEFIHEEQNEIRGKVVISGMGKAGHIGYNIAMTLSSTGTPAVFLHPSEAQHGDLGIIQNRDVLIVISNSGKTREIIELIDLAMNLELDIMTVSITGNKESEVAKKTDFTINIGEQKEICPLGLTPTASTTAMTVIGDILVIKLMEMIGFTKEEYAKRHHGGYLNLKARGLE